MNSDIKDFWNKCHLKRSLENLSGSTYDTDIPFLKVADIMCPGMHILEVGVGMGYVIESLFNKGFIMSALDISEISLSRVAPYCEKLFSIDDLDKLPSDYYDLILCSNVVQHIPTDILKNELTYCIRSLTSDGVLALEFVSTDKESDTGINPDMNTIQNGGCCRTPEIMCEIVAECGGICDIVFNKKVNNDIVRGCHVAHIRRK